MRDSFNEINITPLTDIFLVVSAASLGGTLLAFSIVPIYALIKMIYQDFIKYKPLFSFNKKVE